MASLRSRVLTAAGAIVLTALVAGCADHNRYYYAQTPPPPPPAWASNALVQQASGNGFRDGRSDGERDVLAGYRYGPHADPKFRVTPGYNERFGPFDLYRDTYQDAYIRGYDNGFRHAQRAGYSGQ